jgi:hypothetical protein
VSASPHPGEFQRKNPDNKNWSDDTNSNEPHSVGSNGCPSSCLLVHSLAPPAVRAIRWWKHRHSPQSSSALLHNAQTCQSTSQMPSQTHRATLLLSPSLVLSLSVARERLLRLASSPRCEDNHGKTTGVRVRARAWGAGWFPLLLFRLDLFLVW